MESGFYFDELSDYKKELLQESMKNFPKETNRFLKKSQQELKKEMTRTGKQLVHKKTGTYHKSFKVGKLYERDGNICGRVYNNARHAHLIENGHKKQNGEWEMGKYVIAKSENSFKEEFFQMVEDFIFNEVSK